jgi:hypothetical protein
MHTTDNYFIKTKHANLGATRFRAVGFASGDGNSFLAAVIPRRKPIHFGVWTLRVGTQASSRWSVQAWVCEHGQDSQKRTSCPDNIGSPSEACLRRSEGLPREESEL